MKMEENKRKQLSRRKIEEAFLKELETKSLDQLKVTELCQKADVNRGTFYANYMDIYDLADQIFQQLRREVEGLYHGQRDEMVYSDESFFLSLIQHIRDNQKLFKTCFKLKYDEIIVSLEDYDLGFAEKLYSSEHIEYHLTFFQAGFNAIIRKWLDGGCKEPPEEIAKIIKDEYRGKII